jgi:murein tripeptide amidase MpaA
MLTITNPTTIPSEQQTKKGVILTARVHPGETNASWMMKGLLDFLLNDSADAKVKRKKKFFFLSFCF